MRLGISFGASASVEPQTFLPSESKPGTEIGSVSNEAARLIEEISRDTLQQSGNASRVANSMQEILAVTEQTTEGTQQTAVSIGQLADLAVELKGSVSGFKV